MTLASQFQSEFELHARAVLGLPIPQIELLKVGASAVVLANKEGVSPSFEGVVEAISEPQTDIKIFGKPTTRPYRRMAVTLAYADVNSDVNDVKVKAIKNAKKVSVISQ